MGNLCSHPKDQYHSEEQRQLMKNRNLKMQSYAEDDDEYSVIVSKDGCQSHNGGKGAGEQSDQTIQSLENYLEKTFTGFVNIKISHATLRKDRLSRPVARTFENNDSGQFEEQCELKFGIKYKDQRFKSQSKGFLVSDPQGFDQQNELEVPDDNVPLEAPGQKPRSRGLTNASAKAEPKKSDNVADRAEAAVFATPAFKTAVKEQPHFYMVFRDEVAHNLSKFGNLESKLQLEDHLMHEEQFDVQIASSKDDDFIQVEVTLRENYQLNKGLKVLGVAKISITDLLLLRSSNQAASPRANPRTWDEGWYPIYSPVKELPGSGRARSTTHQSSPRVDIEKEPIGKIKVESRFEDKIYANDGSLEEDNKGLGFDGADEEADLEFLANGAAAPDSDILNRIGRIDRKEIFEYSIREKKDKEYDSLTDEELDRQIEVALNKQRKDQIVNAHGISIIDEESRQTSDMQESCPSVRRSEEDVSEQTNQRSIGEKEEEQEASIGLKTIEDGEEKEQTVQQQDGDQDRESRKEQNQLEPGALLSPIEPSQPAEVNPLAASPEGLPSNSNNRTTDTPPQAAPEITKPALNIGGSTILRNVAARKMRRARQRSKQANMEQLKTGSIHNLRAGASMAAKTSRVSHAKTDSKKQDDNDNPFAKAKDEGNESDQSASVGSEGATQTERLPQLHQTTQSNDLTRKSIGNMSMRSITPSAYGLLLDEDIYDNDNHKMEFKVTRSKPLFEDQNVDDAVFCNLCNDEIDGVLGYFNCAKCKVDYCKECALDRDRLESEMAENPIFVATPVVDIQRDSSQSARKHFNYAIIQNEVQRGNTSFNQRKEYQQNAGEFLTDDLKFDFELKELGLTKVEFEAISAKAYAKSADKFVFLPRPKNMIDKKINVILKLLKIKNFPVLNLKDNLFFVGLYKVVLEMKGDFLMVKVGNKQFERFADYIKQNRLKFEQQLVLLSIKNNNVDLVEVVNRIVMRTYMNGLTNSFMTNMSFSRQSNISQQFNAGTRNSQICGENLFRSGNIRQTNTLKPALGRLSRMSRGGSEPIWSARATSAAGRPPLGQYEKLAKGPAESMTSPRKAKNLTIQTQALNSSGRKTLSALPVIQANPSPSPSKPNDVPTAPPKLVRPSQFGIAASSTHQTQIGKNKFEADKKRLKAKAKMNKALKEKLRLDLSDGSLMPKQ